MTERDNFPTEWSLPVQSSTGPEQESLRHRRGRQEDPGDLEEARDALTVPTQQIGQVALEVNPPAPYAYLGGEEYLG